MFDKMFGRRVYRAYTYKDNIEDGTPEYDLTGEKDGIIAESESEALEIAVKEFGIPEDQIEIIARPKYRKDKY
jgi:hypothetical protein